MGGIIMTISNCKNSMTFTELSIKVYELYNRDNIIFVIGDIHFGLDSFNKCVRHECIDLL